MDIELPLALKTAFADLLDRAASAAFADTFDQDGAFTAKTIKGKRYWYFQKASETGRIQKYVGPETQELLERIKHHKEARNDLRDRQALVSTLVRSAHLPRPAHEIGEVVAALARAGIFRLHGVLVGTVAYQTYSAMLGTRLPATSLQTGDVDVAQFAAISSILEDRIPPILDVLKSVDQSFRPVPTIYKQKITAYVASGGFRVEFLTPNQGKDTDQPRKLPALQTGAQQLRFLDYLIEDPEPSAILHGAGIYVLVPTPQRYAIHKLIVAQRRPIGAAKRDKDLQQAAALLKVLLRKRPIEIRIAWEDAVKRGPKWRTLIGESLGVIDANTRDLTLKAAGATRSFVPGLDLKFESSQPTYDVARQAVVFRGRADDTNVVCAISREALEDHSGVDHADDRKCLEIFRANLSTIEKIARAKYLSQPIEQPNEVIIKSEDIRARFRH